MADRAEVSRHVTYVMTGRQDVASVSRHVTYLILEPGSDEPDTSVKQGRVHAQILRRS